MSRVKMGPQEAILERVTRAQPGIDTDHEYIHKGGFFEAHHRFTLDAAAVGRITIKTPAVKYVHYRKEHVSSSGDKVTIELFEEPTVTAATGTPVAAHNHNRLSAVVSGATVLHTPTVTDDGVQISQSFIGGGTGTGQARSGAELGVGNEWVLKRDAQYLVKITNNSAAANTVQVNLVWYEEDEG